MRNLHHSITSIALLNEKSLNRWLTSIVILIPKTKEEPKYIDYTSSTLMNPNATSF